MIRQQERRDGNYRRVIIVSFIAANRLCLFTCPLSGFEARPTKKRTVRYRYREHVKWRSFFSFFFAVRLEYQLGNEFCGQAGSKLKLWV